jgi:putative Ca2+/H+ antiporter (TMEM165/GDT1 family)
MELKTLVVVFATVFLAELGDKTQLAVFGFASSGRSAMAVFLGASLALMTTTFLGVLMGDRLTLFLPLGMVRRGAALLLIVLGVIIFFKG